MRVMRAIAAIVSLAIAAPLATDTITVRRGETLSAIARRHGVTVRSLAEANAITNIHRIRAGQVLVVPGPAAASSGAPPPAAAEARAASHRVRSGETLSVIARRSGITVRSLAEANGITNIHHVRAGTSLTIPGSSAPSGAGARAPEPEPNPAPAVGNHTIRRGESLGAIAAAYRTTVGELSRLNGITDPHRIIAGTTITVPAASSGAGAAPSTPAPPPTLTHTVQSGETLSTIGKRYGVTAAAIAGHNALRDLHLIRIGQKLEIPGVVPTAPAPGAVPARLGANPDRLKLIAVFDRWAAEYGVPHDLLKAMTWLESGWQQTVVSHTGARGVGQLMPATVDFVRDILIRDRSLDVNDVDDNIRMSARYLRWLLDQAGGDHSLALAGYYQGMAAVRKHGVYTGTRTYVAGVLAFRDRYGWR